MAEIALPKGVRVEQRPEVVLVSPKTKQNEKKRRKSFTVIVLYTFKSKVSVLWTCKNNYIY